MLMIPVPAVAALILGYLAMRLLATGGRWLLVVFLTACAVQSFGRALALGYGARAFQAVLPPLAWISFRASLFASVTWRAALPHMAAPLLCLQSLMRMSWSRIRILCRSLRRCCGGISLILTPI